MKIQAYSAEIEGRMRNFYDSLSEKDRRRYAGIEAAKLGYGGIRYICGVLRCDDEAVSRGIQELNTVLKKDSGIREPGGGRQPLLATLAGLDDGFLAVLKAHTAGSPTDEKIKWTNLTRCEIADKLKENRFNVRVTVVDQLLEKQGFRRRQAFKSEAGKKNVPQRDEPFNNIERLKREYHEKGNPVMSMDVKKKNS